MNTKNIASLFRQLAEEFENLEEITLATGTSNFSPSVKKKIEKYKKEGFTEIYTVDSSISIEKACGLADYENAAWLYEKDNIINGNHTKRPQKYLLLYTKDVPQETKGKTATELSEMFKQKNWLGFTLYEYLLVQRFEFEKRKDHSFDTYDSDSQKSQWTWLLDSRVSSGSDRRVVYAGWHPGYHRVDVIWRDVGDSNPALGARPAVVIPL